MENKKIRILQLGRTLNFGGTETVILNICKGLYNENTFRLFVCSSGGELEKELEKIGIKHFKIGDIGIKNIKNFISIIKKIDSIIKSEEIDIINSHHRTLTIIANFLRILNPNIKVVHTAHYMTKKNYLGKFLGKNIIAVGENVRRNLINNSLVNNEYITVIYNGINVDNYSKSDLFRELREKNINIITLISRLSFEKGVDIFIKFIPDIINRYGENIKIYIIGDGEERKNLENQIDNLNIRKFVEFLGFRKNVLDYIKSSDIIVSTSRTEGLPILPLEVFTQKKTIIATDVGGTNEIVKNNYNGILIRDYTDIPEYVTKLLCDKEYRQELEENALSTVIDTFNIDIMIEKYREYYKNLKRGSKEK